MTTSINYVITYKLNPKDRVNQMYIRRHSSLEEAIKAAEATIKTGSKRAKLISVKPR